MSSAVQADRGPKRVGTLHNTWKTSRPSAGSARQGFELRKLSERLQDLHNNLTLQVGKILSAHVTTAKHQIRQIQLDSRRLQCQKSNRLKILSSVLRSLETKMRALHQGSSGNILSSGDIAIIQTQIQQMRDEQQHIKRDHTILKSLSFRSNVARYDTIPEAHQRTFSWVFSALESEDTSSSGLSLQAWLERGSGIFWISGKPGAGKSTLMKFIADHESAQEALSKWSAPKRAVIVTHYFWCAGTQMQRSHNGLLQTLLFEILRQLPDAIESLLPERWSSPNVKGWAMADLYNALFTIVGQPDLPVKFCFFIDGLDEFDGDHLALCHELMDLAKSENVKLCLSSRPWSVFEEAFGSAKMGNLRLHDLTKSDIVNFVLDRFAQHPETTTSLAPNDLQNIALEISGQSQGVFLWVSLATKCLLEALSEGCSLSTLLENLRRYPSELDDFFTYTLESIPSDAQLTMATSFLITEAAEKPLDVGIYYFHEMEFADPDYVLSLSPEPPSRLEYRRQLSHTTQQFETLCRGLLAVDQKTRVVNCLHRTVRDYLDQPQTKAMLSDKAPSGFSPSLCLLRASAAWTKSSRATMSDEPKAEFLSSITSLLAAAAQLQRPEDLALCRRLLDDLDGCLAAKGPAADESLQIFRSQVIGHRLWEYLSDVQTRRPGYLDRLEVPPLVLALFPDYEIGEVRERPARWDEAVTKTIKCLLEQGQDPNKLFSAAETLGTLTEKSPWIVLCEHTLPQHDDTHIGNIRKLQPRLKSALETGVLEAFLSHGAAPNARCERPGKPVSVVATDYLLHAFRLSSKGEDQVLQELYLAHVQWFAPKDADHLNAVIHDFLRLMEKTHEGGSAFLQRVSEKLLALAT
ncbi:hypothetical protein LMH87_006009 [Akanthomyces muscarius]|uniref:NACHT domain-containing protein n=1 Tax=Akanthomyces muscarius TaxID=2231603 RepID=A0A9W8UPV7_AKAMU|nr:hypothetical protein LMH87_006009 [Akanthomyces muscarius]KAJ4164332.1 hypothetical protein LMH87_006009 [Akanthomyces muscarius]